MTPGPKIRLRKAEHEYINKEMEGCQNTSSQWKLIRNCLPRKETTQQVYTKEVKEVAEEFNEFFVSVGAKASEASKALILMLLMNCLHQKNSLVDNIFRMRRILISALFQVTRFVEL